MSLTLIGFEHPHNNRLWKLAAAARHAGLTYNVQFIEYGGVHQSDAWKKNVHPMGCAPAIQTEEGYIAESNACLRAIARMEKNNSFLYGRTAFEASQVDMWLDYCTCEVGTTIGHFAGRLFGMGDAKDDHKHEPALFNALTGIETWLETRTFLVGERLTIADIELAFALDAALRGHSDCEVILKKFKNLARHYHTVMNQPKTIEALQAHGCAVGLPKPEKKAAEPAKPKEEAKPKKEEKKPAKDDDDEEEDAPMEDKKKPNPLDSLPPSKLVLDAFKREYSNKDTRKEAAPWFFENYDPEGYTCFWCKYKYNDELSKAFMTSNLVRGWFQRMEHVRKYAFGTVLVIGEESKHEIQGFWVFRGKGLPEIVAEVEDVELYTWTEIPDIKKEQEKITDFLAWDGATFATQPVLEGKTFK